MSTRRTTQWIRVLWLGAGFAMLLFVLAGYWLGHWSNREPNLSLLGFLVALSFPIGLLGVFLVGLLADFLSTTPFQILFANRYLEAVTVWVCLTALGWLQWFVVLPWFFRLVRKRFAIGSGRAA